MGRTSCRISGSFKVNSSAPSDLAQSAHGFAEGQRECAYERADSGNAHQKAERVRPATPDRHGLA